LDHPPSSEPPKKALSRVPDDPIDRDPEATFPTSDPPSSWAGPDIEPEKPEPTEGTLMPDNIYSVSEIVGTSKESLDDAIKGAVARAGKTLRNLDWFNVTDIRGHIDDDQVCHYQVTMKVGFRLEEPS